MRDRAGAAGTPHDVPAVMLRIVTIALLGLAACMTRPAALPDQLDAACFQGKTGDACEADGGWCKTDNQCGEPARFCQCVGHHLQCTEPYTRDELASCSEVPPALSSCQVEGTGVCDREPVGGGECSCTNGVFTCWNACDGCPDHVPAEGEACATTHTCRYNTAPATECTCTSGALHCRQP
jgi:hypothetical protein